VLPRPVPRKPSRRNASPGRSGRPRSAVKREPLLHRASKRETEAEARQGARGCAEIDENLAAGRNLLADDVPDGLDETATGAAHHGEPHLTSPHRTRRLGTAWPHGFHGSRQFRVRLSCCGSAGPARTGARLVHARSSYDEFGHGGRRRS
jgi:hypothetical protein